MNKEPNSPNEQLGEKTKKLFEQIDALRGVEMESLDNLQKLHLSVMEQESERLARKYRSEEHPRLKTLTERVNLEETTFRLMIKDEVRESGRVLPILTNSEWRVNGYVYNDDEVPQAGVTVFLANDKGEWFNDLGFDCTDENGYYSITLNKTAIDKHANTPLTLAVSNNQKKLLHLDPEKLIPAPAGLAFREIFLDGATTCISPPGDIKTEPPRVPPAARAKRKK